MITAARLDYDAAVRQRGEPIGSAHTHPQLQPRADSPPSCQPANQPGLPKAQAAPPTSNHPRTSATANSKELPAAEDVSVCVCVCDLLAGIIVKKEWQRQNHVTSA